MAFNPGSGGGISAAVDVALSNAANHNALSYNSSTQKWTNKAITSDIISDFNTAVAAAAGSSSAGVVILALNETGPPANTPVGTIVLREVA